MLQEFINKLLSYARFKFPDSETTKLLKDTPILINELKEYLFFNEQHYTRNLIYQTPDFELLALCWFPGQKSLPHGHEGEKCWTRVEEGKLKFINYKDQENLNTVKLNIINEAVGDAGFVDGPAYIHSVENNFLEPAVGLHLYAKPFHECDVFINNRKERHHLLYYSKYGKIVE